jgi:carboxypeptidase Q
MLLVRRAAASFVFGVALVAPLGAQERVDTDAIGKLKDAELNHSQVMEITSYLTDVYGPRLTGSPGAKRAGDWAVKKLGEWGLANVKLESFPFGRGWSNDRFVAQAVSPVAFPIIGYASAWTPGTKGAVRAEVVMVKADSLPDLEKYRGKLKGKIVFASPAPDLKAHLETAEGHRLTDDELARMAAAEPQGNGGRGGRGGRGGTDFRAAQQFAAARTEFFVTEGIVALVSPGRGDYGTVFTNNGGSRDPKNPTKVAQVFFSGEHYGRIARMLEKNVPVTVELDVKNTFYDADPNSFNIVAEIPGTDPQLKDEVVMLGAHFDSWHAATGATDNAAGSAIMMEAIRLIKSSGLKPRRTIRIALWTGEEQGLLGSRAYVRDHFGYADSTGLHLKPDAEKVSGYFNVDNGTGAIRGVYLQGNQEVGPIFEAWMKPFRNLGMHTLTIRDTGGTDHQAFDAVGLPGFQFIQDPLEYSTRTHHSNMDVYERIQPADMMHNATVVAAFVWQTANRDAKLPRKAPPKAMN